MESMNNSVNKLRWHMKGEALHICKQYEKNEKNGGISRYLVAGVGLDFLYRIERIFLVSAITTLTAGTLLSNIFVAVISGLLLRQVKSINDLTSDLWNLSKKEACALLEANSGLLLSPTLLALYAKENVIKAAQHGDLDAVQVYLHRPDMDMEIARQALREAQASNHKSIVKVLLFDKRVNPHASILAEGREWVNEAKKRNENLNFSITLPQLQNLALSLGARLPSNLALCNSNLNRDTIAEFLALRADPNQLLARIITLSPAPLDVYKCLFADPNLKIDENYYVAIFQHLLEPHQDSKQILDLFMNDPRLDRKSMLEKLFQKVSNAGNMGDATRIEMINKLRNYPEVDSTLINKVIAYDYNNQWHYGAQVALYLLQNDNRADIEAGVRFDVTKGCFSVCLLGKFSDSASQNSFIEEIFEKASELAKKQLHGEADIAAHNYIDYLKVLAKKGKIDSKKINEILYDALDKIPKVIGDYKVENTDKIQLLENYCALLDECHKIYGEFDSYLLSQLIHDFSVVQINNNIYSILPKLNFEVLDQNKYEFNLFELVRSLNDKHGNNGYIVKILELLFADKTHFEAMNEENKKEFYLELLEPLQADQTAQRAQKIEMITNINQIELKPSDESLKIAAYRKYLATSWEEKKDFVHSAKEIKTLIEPLVKKAELGEFYQAIKLWISTGKTQKYNTGIFDELDQDQWQDLLTVIWSDVKNLNKEQASRAKDLTKNLLSLDLPEENIKFVFDAVSNQIEIIVKKLGDEDSVTDLAKFRILNEIRKALDREIKITTARIVAEPTTSPAVPPTKTRGMLTRGVKWLFGW